MGSQSINQSCLYDKALVKILNPEPQVNFPSWPDSSVYCPTRTSAEKSTLTSDWKLQVWYFSWILPSVGFNLDPPPAVNHDRECDTFSEFWKSFWQIVMSEVVLGMPVKLAVESAVRRVSETHSAYSNNGYLAGVDRMSIPVFSPWPVSRPESIDPLWAPDSASGKWGFQEAAQHKQPWLWASTKTRTMRALSRQ